MLRASGPKAPTEPCVSVLLCCCGVQIEEAKRQKEEAKAHLDELEQQLAMYAAPYKLQSAVYCVAEGG